MPPQKKTAGWFCDAHYKLRLQRGAIQQKLDAKKAEIAELEEDAKKHFASEGLEGGKGKLATGYISEVDHVSIADARKFKAYIKRTGHFELYQNRVSKSAYDDLVAAGKKPAGVRIYTQVKFGTTKRG